MSALPATACACTAHCCEVSPPSHLLSTLHFGPSLPATARKTVQTALITIWQRHIADWGYDPADQAVIEIPAPPPAGSQPWPDPQTQPVSRNGHVLQLLPAGGAFCRKCGQQTKAQNLGQEVSIRCPSTCSVASCSRCPALRIEAGPTGRGDECAAEPWTPSCVSFSASQLGCCLPSPAPAPQIPLSPPVNSAPPSPLMP